MIQMDRYAMNRNEQISTYNVTAECPENLGVKTQFLVDAYTSVVSTARRDAPGQVANELVVVQDGRVKTTFHIKFSNRMAPFLIKAIQEQNNQGYGVALSSYFHRLQEQVMAQLFSNVGEISFPKFS
jgi:hypothetical protein